MSRFKGTPIQCLFAVLLTLGAAPARSAQRFPAYPVRVPSAYTISTRQGNVSIGIEPVESVTDQMTYFHTVLSAKGFLPVLIVIRNDSTVDSLLLDKTGISSGLGKIDGSGPKETTPGQKAAIASTGFIPFIGPFVSAGLAEEASEVKQNLVVQELQSGTLSPGDTLHGFLYIPIPRKSPRPKIHIELPIAWSASDKSSVVQVEF